MQVKDKGGKESKSDALSDSDSDREASDSSIPDGQVMGTVLNRLEVFCSFKISILKSFVAL